MADPTIADVLHAIAEVRRDLASLRRVQHHTALLVAFQGEIMSIIADQSKAATDLLVAKAEAALAALATVQASNTALGGQLTTLQAQVAALESAIAAGNPSPSDAAELQAGIAEAQAEVAKIDAALNPVVAPPPAA
jgi:hypothetical protein